MLQQTPMVDSISNTWQSISVIKISLVVRISDHLPSIWRHWVNWHLRYLQQALPAARILTPSYEVTHCHEEVWFLFRRHLSYTCVSIRPCQMEILQTDVASLNLFDSVSEMCNYIHISICTNISNKVVGFCHHLLQSHCLLEKETWKSVSLESSIIVTYQKPLLPKPELYKC